MIDNANIVDLLMKLFPNTKYIYKNCTNNLLFNDQMYPIQVSYFPSIEVVERIQKITNIQPQYQNAPYYQNHLIPEKYQNTYNMIKDDLNFFYAVIKYDEVEDKLYLEYKHDKKYYIELNENECKSHIYFRTFMSGLYELIGLTKNKNLFYIFINDKLNKQFNGKFIVLNDKYVIMSHLNLSSCISNN